MPQEKAVASGKANNQERMDKLGRVFLSFVKEVESVSDTQAPSRGFHSTATLDPGI